MSVKVVLLAAGKGERLWPLTTTRPKPALPVLGKPLLLWHLEALAEAGINEAIIVVHYKAEEIRSLVSNYEFRAKFVFQNELLGTGDAVRHAIEGEQADRTIAIYSDVFIEKDLLKQMLRKGLSRDLIAGAIVDDISSFGAMEVKNGVLREIKEKPQTKRSGLVFAGVLSVDSQELYKALMETRLSPRGEYELTDAINKIAGKLEIEVVELPSNYWADVGTPWDYLKLNRNLLVRECEKRGLVPDDCILLGKNVTIKEPVALEPPLYIGDNAVIGPFASLRGPVIVCRDSKIGFSSQVKGSVILEGAKIPHLNYVGDSIVGERSNLGAGTITANLRHDEKPIKTMIRGELVSTTLRKFGSVIGGFVKTGINTSILPGVKIGAGAWIGAGCIVDRDVPDNAILKCTQERTLELREPRDEGKV
uniref:Nucleotidyl transferase n=1 Tax=Fervidicoccus fontis TaxID=683846 RepID=A0A7J3ZJI5_9CREN